MNVDYPKLLNKARELTKKKIGWHHHYLSPDCELSTSSQHLIILESEGKKWQSEFEEKPLDKLEELENIFFQRTS